MTSLHLWMSHILDLSIGHSVGIKERCSLKIKSWIEFATETSKGAFQFLS